MENEEKTQEAVVATDGATTPATDATTVDADAAVAEDTEVATDKIVAEGDAPVAVPEVE